MPVDQLIFGTYGLPYKPCHDLPAPPIYCSFLLSGRRPPDKSFLSWHAQDSGNIHLQGTVQFSVVRIRGEEFDWKEANETIAKTSSFLKNLKYFGCKKCRLKFILKSFFPQKVL